LFLGCIAFFTASNSLTNALMLITESRELEMALETMYVGTIGAQMALHALWCVLAPIPWGKRLLAGTAAGLVLYAGAALGWKPFDLLPLQGGNYPRFDLRLCGR
jgi:hypothetical protein